MLGVRQVNNPLRAFARDPNLSFEKEPPVKNLFALSLGLAVTLTTTAFAEGIKSGPQEGDRIGAFNVTKVAGAEKDGVKVGANLCYRCRNGQNPQVMVFTRATDEKVQMLVGKLDKAIDDNKSSKLRVFVNLLGEDKEDLSDACEKFASSSKVKNVPFVVPNEFENGPDNYGINSKAAVTITLAVDSKVKASHAFASATDVNVDAVMKDLKKILE